MHEDDERPAVLVVDDEQDLLALTKALLDRSRDRRSLTRNFPVC